jgi:hypothetical protein
VPKTSDQYNTGIIQGPPKRTPRFQAPESREWKHIWRCWHLQRNHKSKQFHWQVSSAFSLLSASSFDSVFLRRAVFTEEAKFHISGRIRRCYCVIRGSQSPADRYNNNNSLILQSDGEPVRFVCTVCDFLNVKFHVNGQGEETLLGSSCSWFYAFGLPSVGLGEEGVQPGGEYAGRTQSSTLHCSNCKRHKRYVSVLLAGGGL